MLVNITGEKKNNRKFIIKSVEVVEERQIHFKNDTIRDLEGIKAIPFSPDLVC